MVITICYRHHKISNLILKKNREKTVLICHNLNLKNNNNISEVYTRPWDIKSSKSVTANEDIVD